MRRHRAAYGDGPTLRSMLEVGGDYAQRMRGEDHAWTSETIGALAACRARQFPRALSRSLRASVNEQNERLMTLRGLFMLKPAGPPVPLDEVEPAANESSSVSPPAP